MHAAVHNPCNTPCGCHLPLGVLGASVSAARSKASAACRDEGRAALHASQIAMTGVPAVLLRAQASAGCRVPERVAHWWCARTDEWAEAR